MSRLKHFTMILTTGLLTAAVAHGQSAGASGQGSGRAGAASNTQATQLSSEASAEAGASAQADMQKLRESIEKKSAKISEQARARAESQLEAASKQVEATTEKGGEANVAHRLGAEFGMSAEAIMDERTQLNASWGQLMIAHSIAANSKSGVTVEQLMEMNHDGMGWGKIAAGLGMKLGSVVSCVKAEGQVANGLVKADGHVGRMQGEGARVGATGNAGLQVGLGAGHTNAGVGLGGRLSAGK